MITNLNFVKVVLLLIIHLLPSMRAESDEKLAQILTEGKNEGVRIFIYF